MSLRVGYVLEAPYPTFFVSEIDAVRRAGAEVTVFNSYRPFAQQDAAAESLRRESHYFPQRYRGLLAAHVARAVRRPAAVARVWRFVLGHGLPARLALLAAHYAGVVEARGIDHIHATYGTTPATVAMLTSWLCGRPYSFTLHAYEIYLPNPLLKQKIAHSSFVTTISQFNRDDLRHRHPEIDLGRVELVRLGVDLGRWPMRAGEPANSTPRCLCVANLIPVKGHDVLLRATALLAARGQPVHTMLVGDGQCRAALEARARELGIVDRVTFAGHRDPGFVRSAIAGADVFVLPGIIDEQGNHDGLPVALMEAMAVGVPVVSSRISGIPELVVDGVTGLLTAPGDVEAVAAAIASLIRQPALRESLTRAGRARVEADYDLARSGARMRDLFAQAAAAGPRG